MVYRIGTGPTQRGSEHLCRVDVARYAGPQRADAGGWLWFVIDVLMVAVLAGAVIYATVLWRRRRGRLEQIGERATARLYEREAERERKAEADRARP